MIQAIKEQKKRFKQLGQWLSLAIRNHEQPLPIYPLAQPEGIKVHLGSGPINIQGWINVDARAASHVHLNTTQLSLKEFSDNSISEVYMCHVLEHFSFVDTKVVLTDIFRKLRPNGVVRISVPDFDAIVEIYGKSGRDLNSIKYALMGGGDYEYNIHKSVFNQLSLKTLLEESGFQNIQSWTAKEDFGIDLGDWSSQSFVVLGKPVPISLNLKGLKK